MKYQKELSICAIVLALVFGQTTLAQSRFGGPVIDKPIDDRHRIPPSAINKVGFTNVRYIDGCVAPNEPTHNSISFDLKELETGRVGPSPNIRRIHSIDIFQVPRTGDPERILNATRGQSTVLTEFISGFLENQAQFRSVAVRGRRPDTNHFTLVARDRNGKVLANTQIQNTAPPVDIVNVWRRAPMAVWRQVDLRVDGSQSLYWALDVDTRGVRRTSGSVVTNELWNSRDTKWVVRSLEPRRDITRVPDEMTAITVLVERRTSDTPRLYSTELSVRASRQNWWAPCFYQSRGDDQGPLTLSGRTEAAPPPPSSLSVTLGGDGSGRVTSSPAGLSCSSGTCSGTFTRGSSVTLTAAPSSGSTFSGWGGACTGTGSCGVALSTSSASVSATFASSSQPPPPPPQRGNDWYVHCDCIRNDTITGQYSYVRVRYCGSGLSTPNTLSVCAGYGNAQRNPRQSCRARILQSPDNLREECSPIGRTINR